MSAVNNTDPEPGQNFSGEPQWPPSPETVCKWHKEYYDLVEKYEKKFGASLALLRSALTVADLYNDCILRVASTPQPDFLKLDPVARRIFLSRKLKWRCIDLLRSLGGKRVIKMTPLNPELENRLPYIPPDENREADWEKKKALLQKAIESLSKKYRAYMNDYLSGKTNEDIAAEKGKSVRAIDNVFCRIRKKISKWIDKNSPK